MLTAFLVFLIVLLVGALVAIVAIFMKTNSQLKRYDAIDDVEAYKNKCAVEANNLVTEAENPVELFGQLAARIFSSFVTGDS